MGARVSSCPLHCVVCKRHFPDPCAPATAFTQHFDIMSVLLEMEEKGRVPFGDPDSDGEFQQPTYYRCVGKQARRACTFPHPRSVDFRSLSMSIGLNSKDMGSGAPWCNLSNSGWVLYCFFEDEGGCIRDTARGSLVVTLKVGDTLQAQNTHTHTLT